MRLVRFVALSGVCSRRNAEKLIKNGEICVNGAPCLQPGLELDDADLVSYQGKILKAQQQHITLILNKPRGVISASSSPHDETTVIDCVSHAYPNVRLFPIGRLDKETTGLILLTSDGDLAYSLSHPKFEVQKKYIALLDNPLHDADKKVLLTGVELEDGVSFFDTLTTDRSKKEITITLHSGKNRIIRRMFAAGGYNVVQLHRAEIGKLTIGNLKTGTFRELSTQELEDLKN